MSQVGGDRFVEEEGSAMLQFKVKNTVVALSGSNPMHYKAMDHIRRQGVIVFIDVPSSDILSRLKQMKVMNTND